jgi:hypothetical protein
MMREQVDRRGVYGHTLATTLMSVVQERFADKRMTRRRLWLLPIRYGVGLALVAMVSVIGQTQQVRAAHILNDPAYGGSLVAAEIAQEYGYGTR